MADVAANPQPAQPAEDKPPADRAVVDDSAKQEEVKTESKEEGQVNAAENTTHNAVMTDEPTTTAADSVNKDQRRDDGNSGDQRHHNKRGNGKRFETGRGRKFIKSTYDDLPVSSDPDEIRRQVEFYLSDSNMPLDNFILQMTGGHKNNPVPLESICNFKRMRHFQPFSAVRDAIKDSTFLNLSEDNMITRKEPLSTKFTDNIDENRKIQSEATLNRSIYAKGFGEEHSSTQTELEDFFRPYGELNAVRLRRTPYGAFKGSVFVEFSGEVTAQDFLALETKPLFEGKDLLIKSKKQYCDEKCEEIKKGNVQPGESRGGSRSHSNHGDNWNERRERDQRGGRGFNARGRGGGSRGHGQSGGRGSRTNRQDRNAERNGGDAEVKSADVKPDVVTVEQTKDNADTGAGVDNASSNGTGKKRARDDDDEAANGQNGTVAAEGNEQKKAKTEDVANDA